MQGKHHYEPQLFHYFDLDSFIPQNHLLRKINNVIDLSFIKELTQPFYCHTNGRPSIDPELFFRIILIGYLFLTGLEIVILLNLLEFGKKYIILILIMANSP